MLDVSFITNYFVIKALRKWTDARTEDSYHALTDDGTKAETAEYPASLLETILFGWVLGKIKPDPYSAQRFPAWKPIPLYFGLTTTSGLILITLAFLSPQFMFKQFGITFTGAPTTTQVCDPDTKNRTLIELNNTLKEMLNFDAAMDQFNTLRGMTEALQKDTLLYGTPGFTCKGTKVVRSNGAGTFSLDGTINQWTDPDKRFKFPAAKWGTYFPGYCRAFHDAERKLDSLAVCGPRYVPRWVHALLLLYLPLNNHVIFATPTGQYVSVQRCRVPISSGSWVGQGRKCAPYRFALRSTTSLAEHWLIIPRICFLPTTIESSS